MEKIGNLFQAAAAPAVKYKTEQNKKIWCPEFARFKLQFKWRNGTTSIPYHSYDVHRGKGGVNITDESVGFSKLLLWIEKNRVQDLYVVATIFANITDDLRTYVDGRLNMNYDHIVFKHVRGQNPFSSKFLTFRQGKVDINLLRRGVGEGDAA